MKYVVRLLRLQEHTNVKHTELATTITYEILKYCERIIETGIVNVARMRSLIKYAALVLRLQVRIKV